MEIRTIVTDESYKVCGVFGTPTAKPLTALRAARNGIASFQVLLYTGRSMRVHTDQSTSFSNQMSIDRFRVAVETPLRPQMFLEGFVRDDNNIPYADILCKEPVEEYDGTLPAPIWVDIPIPADATPGEYAVAIKIYHTKGCAGETLVEEKSLKLIVHSCCLPDSKDYRIYVDLWQHNSNLARYYGVPLWSDAHFSIMRGVVKTLAELGQKSVMVLAGDCPWRGWGCYLMRGTPTNLFEYSIISITRDQFGAFHYDFKALQRYVDLCAEYGIDGDITVYGLVGIWKLPYFPGPEVRDYPECVLIRYKDEKDGCYRYMDNRDDVLSYVHALAQYFRETNQFAKVRIASDEPSDMEAYSKTVELLRSVAPGVKFKMAVNHAPVIRKFTEEVEDVAASFPCTCNENDFLRENKKKYPSKRLLWYVCNIPDRPNSVLNSSFAETRLLGSLNYHFGFDGFLRWAYTCWTEEPNKDIRYSGGLMPAGDMNLVYPDKHGGINLSLRWKALKRGIEDYELMARLRDVGKETVANAALRKILIQTDTTKYMKTERVTAENIFSMDYSDYILARAMMEDALVE